MKVQIYLVTVADMTTLATLSGATEPMWYKIPGTEECYLQVNAMIGQEPVTFTTARLQKTQGELSWKALTEVWRDTRD